jgi:hypothetical protein
MKKIALHLMAVAAALVLAACNRGESANPPPGGLTAEPRDSSVILSWSAEEGIDYWLFFAASSALSSANAIGLPGGKIITHVTSPSVVSGLSNDTTYYFTINGRKNDGPGGSDAPVVSATPRFAGAQWTAGPVAGTNDLRSVAFGSQFVAVGANGAMFFSPNGTQLTAAPFVVASDLNAVVYNGTPAFYVAAGAEGAILTSPDGRAWQVQNSGTTNTLAGLATSGQGFVVAVGPGGTILTSPNAVDWTLVNPGTTENLNGAALASGRLVVVGAGGLILTTTDGVTWQPVASGVSVALNAVAFGAGRFVAVGGSGTVATSTDGIAWTPQASLGPVDLASVTFGTQFVAVGSAGTVFTSTDGSTWTARSSGTSSALNAVAPGNFGYTAVGAAGTNLTSY